ncbi:hypothetical protein DITRI_Ditri20bG0044400 [Diplodiscus trichospermus]
MDSGGGGGGRGSGVREEIRAFNARVRKAGLSGKCPDPSKNLIRLAFSPCRGLVVGLSSLGFGFVRVLRKIPEAVGGWDFGKLVLSTGIWNGVGLGPLG